MFIYHSLVPTINYLSFLVSIYHLHKKSVLNRLFLKSGKETTNNLPLRDKLKTCLQSTAKICFFFEKVKCYKRYIFVTSEYPLILYCNNVTDVTGIMYIYNSIIVFLIYEYIFPLQALHCYTS